MARKEMLEFTRSLFRGRPDLSTLTQSIVRQRFLAHAGRDHLEPREKVALKRLVEEELLRMQEEEASAREKLVLVKKVKRPPSPCSDQENKRCRFNSESDSESISGASSPDSSDSLVKNRLATKISATKERPRRTSKKAVESSDEEEHQEDSIVKTGSEEDGQESSEEEGSSRTSKVGKAESSEEEQAEGKEDEEGEREPKGRARKQPGMNNKRIVGKTSASRKQARDVSEDSGEGEPIQRVEKKMGRETGAKSHQESENENEEERENLVEEKKREDNDWKARPQSNERKSSACGENNHEQKSRAARLLGDKDREEQKEKADSDHEANSSGEELSLQRKRKNRPQSEGRNKQSGSSEEDEEDILQTAKSAKGTFKSAKGGRHNGEESDLEREVSDSEAEGSPKGERKNRSSKKSSKKGRTRSSSFSSSDGSPEPKGRKAGSGRRGEDHPAVMRLKRYIRACGARRNYKKLLGSCHSHKERLSVLRAELEALGMKGNPSLEKCRALKEQREEAAEVASLDVTNIINCSGRPRRRTAWNPSVAAPPGELYRRALDSEEERPHPPPPDWSHLRGIISSDGESN